MRKIIICAVLAALLLSGCVPGTSTAPKDAASKQPSQVASIISEQPSAAVSGQAAAPSAVVSETAKPTEEVKMAAASSGIVDGVIDPKYGHSQLSLPLEITGAPEGTACFALYMDDPDAVPVVGYRFVHWMAANIKESSIPEDFSSQAGESAVQGKSDFGDIGYGGPAPPDKDHTYVITIYALDEELPLSKGFSKDKFTAAVEGHTLATATLEGLYRK